MKPQKRLEYSFAYCMLAIVIIGTLSLGLFWVLSSLFVEFHTIKLLGGLLMLMFTYLLTAAITMSH